MGTLKVTLGKDTKAKIVHLNEPKLSDILSFQNENEGANLGGDTLSSIKLLRHILDQTIVKIFKDSKDKTGLKYHQGSMTLENHFNLKEIIALGDVLKDEFESDVKPKVERL